MIEAALPRWTSIPRDWKRKKPEFLWPEMALIHFPKSLINFRDEGAQAPKVSQATGTKWYDFDSSV